MGVTEVTPQGFQGVPFVVDLGGRSEAQVPEEGDRGAPALQGVLEQEARDKDGQGEEPPIHGEPQH
jgi:hypothetical protein